MKRGILFALGAYTLWGLLPIYWRALHAIPALQILSHRFVWSLAFVVLILLIKRQGAQFRAAIASPRVFLIYALAAGLLAVNWGTYIWSVNAGFIVETSLGYYINPLVSVLLGVIFLKERLRPLQWLPIGLAALGVLYLTFTYGSFPWIALVLAFSFGLYGLVKKVAPLGALYGLTLETALMVLPAVLFLVYSESQGQGVMGHVGLVTEILLVLTGVVTALPLLLFAAAARRTHLTTIGVLQYLAPTLQFLLGILVYQEPFTPNRLVGFGVIWLALVLYTGEGLLAWKRAPIPSRVSATN